MSDSAPELLDDDPKKALVRWAHRSAYYLKRGEEALDPPVGIFDYPDLLERGWGWDRLLTSESSVDDMPTYKKYLKDYYSHNTAESVAQAWLDERGPTTAYNGTGIGTGLMQTLAIMCIEAEEKFTYKRRMYKIEFTTDEINLSKKIQEGVRHFISLDGEFPVAATALMFITKEAELMCEWLDIGTYHPHNEWCSIINTARRCALDFMMYKGPESFSIAGLMMGIAKETKTICEVIRENPYGRTKCSSAAILEDGWDVLETLHAEIFYACQDGTTAKINTIGELTSKENGGHRCKTKGGCNGINSMD